ncbi:hypothetical protein J15TS10_40660 [Paenibacillus woosongensis]|uniref:Uncharacterized protein n=1 Tax=Paenibacillus woosongensis TaxID=307580 RepID=A0ABQ4MWE8_9BACL|nr:hypothetical protein J15TS10_40660 [Paenibacillus woosongensis]
MCAFYAGNGLLVDLTAGIFNKSRLGEDQGRLQVASSNKTAKIQDFILLRYILGENDAKAARSPKKSGVFHSNKLVY